jgi:glycosyltransferase involved in cell wall biosynthesis
LANGIDVEGTVAQRKGFPLREALGLSSTAFVFGSIGRLEHQKGYSWLLGAFGQFLETGATAYLVLAGEGSLYTQLARQVREIGLRDYVYLLDGRTDYLSIIDQFDVFVSSSLWEGLSTVIMEAMALGTPVIATAVAGSSELVKHSKTGLLISPHDVDSAVEALLFFYQNPQARQGMAKAAQAHVRNFGFACTAAAYADFYTEPFTAN